MLQHLCNPQAAHKVASRTARPAFATVSAALVHILGLCIDLEDTKVLVGTWCNVVRGRAVEYDFLVDGPQDTLREDLPFTAFPDADAVAPAGTCAAKPPEISTPTVQTCLTNIVDMSQQRA